MDDRGGEITMAAMRRLCVAILDNAIAILRRSRFAAGGRETRLVRETREWIRVDDYDSLFSFANVCELLDFPADRIRQAIRGLLIPVPRHGRRAAR